MMPTGRQILVVLSVLLVECWSQATGIVRAPQYYEVIRPILPQTSGGGLSPIQEGFNSIPMPLIQDTPPPPPAVLVAPPPVPSAVGQVYGPIEYEVMSALYFSTKIRILCNDIYFRDQENDRRL